MDSSDLSKQAQAFIGGEGSGVFLAELQRLPLALRVLEQPGACARWRLSAIGAELARVEPKGHGAAIRQRSQRQHVLPEPTIKDKEHRWLDGLEHVPGESVSAKNN